MSTDIQQETQEVENTESTEVVESISATEDIKETTETQTAKEESAEKTEPEATEESVPDAVVEETLEATVKEEEYIPPPVAVLDYLDPSILDIKVVTEEDLDQYEEEEFVPNELHDQYADTFNDIKEREVVSGTVVGLTDRDVLVDIGFKAEGIIHRSEFEELPEVGQEIDVFIITFEDRRGNIILSLSLIHI